MNHLEFEPSINASEADDARPIDPKRAHKLSAEVLRAKLPDMTTPLVEQKPIDPLEPVRNWRRFKEHPPTGAETFYFRNNHGK